MQLLNSKNYRSVSVYIRGMDEPMELDAARGLKLMEYLTTTDKPASHIQLTDVQGYQVVVNRHDISRIVPDVDYAKMWDEADMVEKLKHD